MMLRSVGRLFLALKPPRRKHEIVQAEWNTTLRNRHKTDKAGEGRESSRKFRETQMSSLADRAAAAEGVGRGANRG